MSYKKCSTHVFCNKVSLTLPNNKIGVIIRELVLIIVSPPQLLCRAADPASVVCKCGKAINHSQTELLLPGNLRKLALKLEGELTPFPFQ